MVDNYLREKGFSNTLETLNYECSMKDQALRTTAIEGATKKLHILHNTVEDAKTYTEQYQKLREFVSGSSLDVYKVELEQVLFPIFVHCFLDMHSKDYGDEAKRFWRSYVADHQLLYNSDLNMLKSVINQHHLSSNEKAQMFLKHKFGLRMSEDTFTLFRNFLHDSKLMTILFIINRHLNIDVFVGEPSEAAVGEPEAVLTGYAESSRKAEEELNKRDIQWGSLETPAVATRRAEMKQGGQPETGAPAAAGKRAAEDTANAEAQKKAKNELVTGEGCQLASEESTVSMEKAGEKVPLPPLDDEKWQEDLESLRKAVKVSCKALPSVCCYTVLNAHASMSCMEVCAETNLVAAGFDDSLLRVWDLKAGAQSRNSAGLDAADGAEGLTVLSGHSGPVYATHFSPCNKFMVSASEDKSARLWSLDTKSCLVAYKGHNYPVWDCKFSPLGIYFATASHDRTARIWSTDHVHPLRILAGHLSDVDCLAWHPNVNYIATGSSDKTLRLWDIQTGNCVRLFTGHHGTIYSAAVSPNGRLLASAGEDHTVKLWDLAEGRLIKSMQGHTDVVWSLDFSKEGTVLASGGADNTVRLWDVCGAKATAEIGSMFETPEGLIRTLPTKQTPISLVRFSSRNILLAGGAFQQSVL